ncbi:MAG: tetratricopeptide repeat protein, partial [Nitrospirae bacterium]|nr:tetratricopeptide repeat protein [Nitrospirota bacterium]
MNIENKIQLAKKYYESNQLQKAIETCKDNLEILLLLGEIAYRKEDYQSAEEILRQTISYNPDSAELYNNLGLILDRRGKFEEAIQSFKKAIEIDPEIADVHYNLGNVFKVKGELDDAITQYQIAIQQKPDLVDAYNNLGIVLQEKKNYDESIIYYQKAIQLDQHFAMAYFNLGTVLQLQQKIDESILNYKKALELNPEIVNAYFNLGNAYYEKGLLDEAFSNYQEVLRRDPNFTDALVNCGIILHEKQSIQEAISVYKKVLKLKPDDPETHWNLSNSLLLSGDYENGWREYEWRLKIKEFEQRKILKPLWDGSDVSQKTVLIYTEQGLGDAIQFVRYIKFVAQKAAKIILECQKELKSIFKNIKGIQQIILRGEHLPEFDVHCPLMSLPFIFRTTLKTIPSEIPYLFVDPLIFQKWHKKFKIDGSKLKVGLVWSGNPKYKKHYCRSFPLITYAPLTALEDVTFYSLQKGEAGKEAKRPPLGLKLIDYTEEINDFSDTAAIIENLDLVISVDTAVAHLAGALGKPVWVLLPYVPDWRWMLDREDSPWYPTMRL